MTIQEFRGKTLVSIREYYKKDGKELPTSKGNLYITFKLSLLICFEKQEIARVVLLRLSIFCVFM